MSYVNVRVYDATAHGYAPIVYVAIPASALPAILPHLGGTTAGRYWLAAYDLPLLLQLDGAFIAKRYPASR